MILPMSFLMTLAGASINDWSHFTNSITQGTPDSPIRGSIGISYGMSQNICQLYEAIGKDDATFLRVVQTFLHAETRTPTTAASAKLCLTFVKWMCSPNDTFVIRKGTKGMWMARRTTPLMVDTTQRYPLRFHYTVIGVATEDIQRRIDAAYSGTIMPAVLNV